MAEISDLDTMQFGRVAEAIDKIKPKAVFIDGLGVGAGVVDRLRQLGYGSRLGQEGGRSA